ncbi:hypothetical protein Q5H93_07630 [Hymenobacter sp. ASUV-10]|uniref:T9SS type A sorting domain-containing protein n=1 Tax=Hymenobacter aranciens TaxID=3063996 RepID=A0ABT9BAB9_9BACT|nr:hypothetical protein [Hymenobacter sp. ASUV-10]MDO7874598.1 hypothetical protein [Hymenobacter sp. ASUV-10]
MLFETAATSLAAYPSRTVWRNDYAVAAGTNPLHAWPTCAAGAYTLTAEIGGQVLRQRLLKE